MSKAVCSVPGCFNKRLNIDKTPIRFYSFPSRPWLQERRETWIKFVNRTNKDGSRWTPKINSSLICSAHFVGGSKSEDPRHPGYNPTIYDPTKKGGQKDASKSLARYHRVVARWNREKQEKASLISEEAINRNHTRNFKSVKKIDSTIHSPQSDKDNDSLIDDTLSGSPMNVEVKIESDPSDYSHDIQINRHTKVIEGPKQLLCLICCDHCSPESYKAYCNNINFMRLCNLLYPSLPEGNMFLDSLKSLDSLSICTNCQQMADSLSHKRKPLFEVSLQVRQLQAVLLKELKILQQLLKEFQGEMNKIQNCVRNSNEEILQSYLEESNNNNNDEQVFSQSVQIRNSAIVNFRRKLVHKVDNLAVFAEEIQEKVDCRRGGGENCLSVVNSTLNQNTSSCSSRIENKLSHVGSPEPIDISSADSQSVIQDDVDDNPCDDPLPESSVSVPPTPASTTTQNEIQNKSGCPNKRPIQLPIVLGKTVKQFANSKIVVEHVWDGAEMKTVYPYPYSKARSLKPWTTPSRKKVAAPKNLVPCPACQRKMTYNFLPFHRQYSCPVTLAKQPPPLHLCHLCSKTFKFRSLLDSHIKNSHCEERPFLCAQCPVTCKTIVALENHEKTHSDERPFVCRKGCGAGFKYSNNRKCHESLCNGKGTPFRKKAKQVAPPTTQLATSSSSVLNTVRDSSSGAAS